MRKQAILTQSTVVPASSAPLDWERLRPAVTPELLSDITRRIVEHFHPEKVILFGSYAYGQPHLSSDVDLLVIMESDEPIFSRMGKVHDVARVPFLPMDVIVRTPQELEERLKMGDYFLAEVLAKGRVLYDAAR